MFLKQAKEPDPNVRVQNAVELNEYDWHNMPCTPVVGVPTLLSFRPDSVQGWAPHREDVTEAAINNLETAFPVR
jgi:hypothetical protein